MPNLFNLRDMNHRTWIEIDESALIHNINELRSLIPKEARFCAVVKANAYGHDLKTVSRVAARTGVDAFAVDTLDDALYLKTQFPSSLVLILGYVLHERLHEAIDACVHLTVYDKETIRVIEEVSASLAKKAFVHLKIETGTNRQGVLEDDLETILLSIKECGHVELVAVSTHFANLEDANDLTYAKQQFDRLITAKEKCLAFGLSPQLMHSACSAAIILYPDTHDGFVRAGISMYGLWPSSSVEISARQHSIACELKPVLSWKTKIAQVKTLPLGSPVGYGLTERLTRTSRIAIIPVGYYDGYDTGLRSCGQVIVKGKKCKIVGRICMNMCMVDVSDVPDPRPEDEVIFLGTSGNERVSADELANLLGTINYEVVTRINPLLPRLLV